jgi:hypothetical protein
MESWRIVWLQGFAPVLSLSGLEALKIALQSDDKRLTQGSTTKPPPLLCVRDWPVEAACALGLCGWLGDGLSTVGEVEEHFAKCCFNADQTIGEPAACRHFLNWYDDTPRDEMRNELLAEVETELVRRGRGLMSDILSCQCCSQVTYPLYRLNIRCKSPSLSRNKNKTSLHKLAYICLPCLEKINPDAIGITCVEWNYLNPSVDFMALPLHD